LHTEAAEIDQAVDALVELLRGADWRAGDTVGLVP